MESINYMQVVNASREAIEGWTEHKRSAKFFVRGGKLYRIDVWWRDAATLTITHRDEFFLTHGIELPEGQEYHESISLDCTHGHGYTIRDFSQNKFGEVIHVSDQGYWGSYEARDAAVERLNAITGEENGPSG